MSQGYISRSFQPGDEAQIVPLLEKAFNEWPFFDLDCTTIDHWKWRYLDSARSREFFRVNKMRAQ